LAIDIELSLSILKALNFACEEKPSPLQPCSVWGGGHVGRFSGKVSSQGYFILMQI